MSEDRLIDAGLPFPCMHRLEEHPDAFKMMIQGRDKVPQILRLWVNFDTARALAQKFVDGAVFMEHGPNGIYGIAIPSWKMQSGHEPRLVETTTSNLVVPGGASAAAVAADEAKKEDGEEKTDE